MLYGRGRNFCQNNGGGMKSLNAIREQLVLQREDFVEPGSMSAIVSGSYLSSPIAAP